MSSSLMRLGLIGYMLGLSLILCLLLWPSSTQAQTGFGTSTGWRATPGLPVIAIPLISGSSSGSSFGGSGGVVGAGGSSGGSSVSGSFSTQIIHINLGQFFPDNGQLIGLPPPPFEPLLNNYLTDTTGSPLGLITAMGMGGGAGGGGMRGGMGGGMGGGMMGMGGGIGGGMGGGGMGGGGMGGFAGKGMGGFNGKKAL